MSYPGSKAMTYGFIGLGLMGKPMAINLASKLENGSKLLVFDLDKAAMEAVHRSAPSVVVESASLEDVAGKSDVIFTMLPEGRHVRAVYLDGAHSLSTQDLNSKILIDCSTIDTATNLYVKDKLAQLYPQSSFYDAPVSGGTIGAISGTIAFFLGCSPVDTNFKVLEPLLRTMGSEIIACGGPSLGLVSKLANNYLSGTITIACSEAFDMGIRSGVSAETLYRVFGAGTAQNTICDRFCPVPNIVPKAPSSNDYRGGFKIQLMKKDYTLAMDMAKQAGSRVILGDVGLGAWQDASHDDRFVDRDSRVIYQYVRSRSESLSNSASV